MTLRLELHVRGIPVPQGSVKAFVAGKRAIVVSNQRGGKLDDWRQAIATEARAAMGSRPLLEGPVVVRARFTWPRPKSHRSSSGGLRPAAPFAKTTPPDIDKASRALLDALTGVVFRDDAQVVRLDAGKSFDDIAPGVAIVIEEAIP